MKKRIKRFVSLFCVLVMIFSGSFVFAESNSRREEAKERITEMYESLGLSDGQKSQLEEHRKSQTETHQRILKQIRKNKQELDDELEKKHMDMNKVENIHAELKLLRSQKDDLRLEGIVEVRKILTEEQFSKFIDFKESRKDRWKKNDRNDDSDE